MPEANLRDVTVEPNPPAAAAPVEPVAAPAAPIVDVSAVADKDALELGRLLLNSGVSKDTVNDLLQAPQALQTMRYLVQNNPQEFLNLIERTDSNAGEKFLESMADTYVKRYAPKDSPSTQANKNGKTEASAEIMNEVAQLREELGQFRTQREQEANRVAMAGVKARYENRVDELFGALPKEVALTKSEQRALKAQLSVELSEDPSAVQRVANGNFVDVPTKFKSIVEGWASDRKATADAAKAQREGRLSAANAEFLGGPQQFQIDPKDADSWDATESGFAKALEQAGGR